MATWQETVDSLAARVQRPFDENLKAELLHILNYRRNLWLHRTLEQYPSQRRMYLQTAVYETERTDASECPELALTGCTIVRTQCEVLQPIRSRWSIFDYVGDVSGLQNYPYAASEIAPYMKESKFTAEVPRWFYSDKRIYIYNAGSIKFVKVRGIFENPIDGPKCGCLDVAQSDCFDDTAEIVLPADILALIVQEILSIELQAESPIKLEDKEEIQVDKTEAAEAE